MKSSSKQASSTSQSTEFHSAPAQPVRATAAVQAKGISSGLSIALASALLLFTAATAWALYDQAEVVAFNPGDATPPVRPVLPTPTGSAAPQVEVVFVLDTTSSMSGLIASAKEKIWSIASAMAQAQPAPQIKMGLVAYRDRGDAYVTQVYDLSQDLDAMYAQLMELRAEGGGDGPESVNQALHEALHQIHWSQQPGVYQSVFLVGDAPPHMDYPDDVPYQRSLRDAQQRGIVVNSIQCGDWAQTRGDWQAIAQQGGGRYFQVEQGGGALAAVSTPYDAELAKVTRELEASRLFTADAAGKAEAEMAKKVEAKIYAISAPAALAARASFSAGASGRANLLGENELIEAYSRDESALSELDDTALPEVLQELAPPERKEKLAELVVQRRQLSTKLEQLSEQRSSYLAAQAPAAEETAWDKQLLDTVREQAARKGLNYAVEKAPDSPVPAPADPTAEALPEPGPEAQE